MMITSTKNMYVAILVMVKLMYQHTVADDGQFSGGSMSCSMEQRADGNYMVSVEQISGWVLGMGPCGPGCSKSDIGRSTRSTRTLKMASDPYHFGNFTTEHLDRSTHNYIINDSNAVVDSTYNESVLAVSEGDGWEQDLMHFSLIISYKTLDVKYEGRSWRKLTLQAFPSAENLKWHMQCRVSSKVRNDTGKPNRSPQSLFKPFYRVKLDETTRIHIPAIDADGDLLKCHIAKYVEAGGIQPPLNVKVFENCTVYINASMSNNYTDDTWMAVAVTVRDYPRKTIIYGDEAFPPAKYSLSTHPVQFVVQVLANLVVPGFVEPTLEGGHTFILYGDTTWRARIYAEAAVNTTLDSLTAIGLHGEIFSLSALQEDPLRPQVKYATISWKPSDSDIGNHIACINAEDNTAVESTDQRCFILDVRGEEFNYTTKELVGNPYFVDIPAPDIFVKCKVHVTCVVALFVKSLVQVTNILVTESYVDNLELSPIQLVTHKSKQMYQTDLSFEHHLHGKERICFMASDKNGGRSDEVCIQTQIEPKDPCLSAPCMNSGQCVSDMDTGTFRCLCLPIFSGKTCSIMVGPCMSNPCVRGRCFPYGSRFFCKCPSEFTGKLCETSIKLTLNGPNNTYLKVPVGSELTINCNVSGSHPPTFYWSKLNACGTKYQSVKASTYHQSRASLTDAGTYVCTASDGHGPNVTSYFHVDIISDQNKEVCDFDDGTLCDWTQQQNDNFDWTFQNGPTQSDGTGPDVDHTLGTLHGKYVYIESSSPRAFGEQASLLSHVLPANRTVCFEFWYYMFGDGSGELFVLTQDTCLKKETQLLKETGDHGAQWNKGSVTINKQSVPNDYRIVIKADVGPTYHGDTAVDDLVIHDGPCQDSNGAPIVG